jgi:ribosomal protein S18 acetylase RimI-like enzyme
VGTASNTLRPGYRFEGLVTFLERVAALIKANENLDYYLYACRLSKRNEADFLPKIREFTLKTISTIKELDDLTAAGFDLSLDSPITRRGIEKGAVAFLLFVGTELASRELVATSAAAKAAIDKYPYKVDFEHAEACASGVWTNPKFRNQGLHLYVFYKAYDYLRENGIQLVRSIVWIDNIAAQKAHARFAPDIKKYARGRYFKILGLPFCKEVVLK